MQDGIFHRKVSVFSCNRENCDFLYSKLLTCILRSAILKLLGQSEKTAFFPAEPVQNMNLHFPENLV